MLGIFRTHNEYVAQLKGKREKMISEDWSEEKLSRIAREYSGNLGGFYAAARTLLEGTILWENQQKFLLQHRCSL